VTTTSTNNNTSPPTPAPTPRSIWIALILIAGVIIGAAAGLLSSASGASVPSAVLTGGGAFAGSVLLMLALLSFATGK
jgi:hypothetical protein